MSYLKRNNRIFDQFKLAELFGGDHSKSSMGMLVLRNLQKHKQLPEGELANKIGSRLHRPEWKPFIETLEKVGYVAITPSGIGYSRILSLTELAKDYLAECEIAAEPDPAPVVVEEHRSFDDAYFEVTGKRLE